MANDPPSRAAGNQGSSPVGAAPQRSRGKLIGLVLGVIVLLVLLALLLSQCGGSDDDANTSSASSSSAGSSSAGGSAGTASASSDGDSSASSSSAGSATTSAAATSAAPAAGAAGAAGSVTAGGQSLLEAAASPDPATALAALSGQAVSATAVQVLSVPADEGFWVGSSDADRVWVQLTGTGESSYQVVQGDTVDFAGTLVAHDAAFAGTVGVDAAEGADQLTTEAQHVEVARDAVTLSA